MDIDLSKLRKEKIMISTPMYGGLCHGQYANSIRMFSEFAVQHGLPNSYHALFGESLIQRARNYCVEEFLQSDCTHLMFIDSDITFNPVDVVAAWYITDPDEGRDIVCGPYPKKTIAWEKVRNAALMGVGEKNPRELENYVGEFVFNPIKTGQIQIDLSKPLEIGEGASGFMCIHRRTFEKYRAAYPDIMYVPDHISMAGFDGSRKIGLYFDSQIDPESNRYLSEDYNFCRLARAIGMKVWLLPWMKLDHTGSFTFNGSMIEILKAGQSLTTTPTSEIQKIQNESKVKKIETGRGKKHHGK